MQITQADYQNLIKSSRSIIECIQEGQEQLAIDQIEVFIDICEEKIEQIQEEY